MNDDPEDCDCARCIVRRLMEGARAMGISQSEAMEMLAGVVGEVYDVEIMLCEVEEPTERILH